MRDTTSQTLAASVSALANEISEFGSGLKAIGVNDADAQTQAANAAASAAAAAASATTASNAQSAVAASATAASNSATSASSSASSATLSANNAATSASNAATSESNAATSASNAATSASNAATSEANIQTLTTSTTTLDPTKKDASVTLSNVNSTAAFSGANQAVVLGTQSYTSGKYYFEVTFQSGTASSNAALGIAPMGEAYNVQLGYNDNTGAVGWFQNSGNTYINGSNVGSYTSFNTPGNVACVAVDFGAKLIWFRTNAGNWNNSGTADPATGTGGLSFTSSSAMFPAICTDSASVWVSNFGGQEAFTYTPPAGFSSWGQNVSSALAAVQAATNAANAAAASVGNSGVDPVNITVGASPFSWQATADGLVIISGTPTDLKYQRNAVTTDILENSGGRVITNMILPIFKGDTLTVSYSTAPALIFIQR